MGASLRFPDFDALVELHRHDPQSFEEVRRAMLRAAVDEAPDEHKPALEQLLVRIENMRAQAATPGEAVQDAFRMMCDSVDRLRDAWDLARHAAAEWQTTLLIEKVKGKQ